jgi:RNA polymerase sigma factor (TIGR02999 family)
METNSPVTSLLIEWRNGDSAARDQLISLVYEELYAIAHRRMSAENPNHMLQTTALVNEAWLKMAAHSPVQFQDRVHFFSIAANIMRQILVDYARKQNSEKNGGDFSFIQFQEDEVPRLPTTLDNLVELNKALDRLAEFDPRKSKIVELRYFGGLSIVETAQALDISVVTVNREWTKAKAWLFRELNGNGI